MTKDIRDCTVAQLYLFRLNNLDKFRSGEMKDLPISVVMFLENPRLKNMTETEKKALWKQYKKELRPEIIEREIELP